MDITEVRIKLMEESEDRLRAFCSVTFDHCFVIRDLKIIEGTSGPFVAMPSRKLTGRCNRCGYKNHLRSNFCNQCGSRLRGGSDLRDQESGSNRLYADIAHPINQACRDLIQQQVILEYDLELQRAKVPGYKSRYDDDYFEEDEPIEDLPKQESVVNRPHFDAAKPTRESVVVSSNGGDEPPKEKVASQSVAGDPPALTGREQPPKDFGLGILDTQTET
ncbi:MAG: SpoVG family protein [Planctomycetota bacterium]|nr:SpoVG family protein [Planctomycetota bacterium]